MIKLFLQWAQVIKNYLCSMIQQTDFISLVKSIFCVSDQLYKIDELSRMPNILKQKYIWQKLKIDYWINNPTYPLPLLVMLLV